VIRAGAGIYYENSIFNNTLFDRPAKLAKGLFFQEAALGCNGAGATTFNIPGQGNITSINGVDLGSGVCGQPLSVAGPLLFDLQQEFQAVFRAWQRLIRSSATPVPTSSTSACNMRSGRAGC
jgi:hypothetical protein